MKMVQHHGDQDKKECFLPEMAQCFCVYSDLPEDLSLVCSTHVRWVTMSCNSALEYSVPSSSLHVYLHTCSSTCTYIHKYTYIK